MEDKEMRALPFILFVLVSVFADGIVVAQGSYQLVGTIRDFKRGNEMDGHPDFETMGEMIDDEIVESLVGEDGKPVYAGDPTTLTTTGQANFDQWYRDVPDVNERLNYAITMTELAPSAYEFSDTTFFPIDDQLFGNQEQSHNYSFTFEIHGKFTYNGEFDYVLLASDDDMWLFIDGQLAVDMGGVHAVSSTEIELANLGLTPSQEYSFDLFYAERHTPEAQFRLQTSFVLSPAIPGDYNDDRIVDAADYTVWRNHLGETYQLINEGFGVTPGIVTAEDYTVWKDNYGLSAAGVGSLSSLAAVPEPATGTMILGMLLLVAYRRCSYHYKDGCRPIRPATAC